MLGRMGTLERSQAASAEEHRELVGFQGRKFDRIDRRFVKLDFGLEGVRDEVRILAEG
jgi:hypothetical protein